LSARSKIEAYFSGITVSPLLFFTPYLPFISDTNTVAVWDYAEKLKMEMSRKNIFIIFLPTCLVLMLFFIDEIMSLSFCFNLLILFWF